MNFLYWIPGHAGALPATAADLPAACGLGEILAGASIGSASCRGPMNADGLLLHAQDVEEGGQPSSFLHDPDKQEWRPAHLAPGAPATHWIGWWKDKPPRPADLQRPERVNGHPVKLADGNQWIVPVCGPRYASGPDGKQASNGLLTLPKRMEDEAGETVLRVVPRFDAVCAESERWYDIFQADAKFPWNDIRRYAAMLLGVNYRIGYAEVGALGLLDTTNYSMVVDASLGGPDIRAWLDAKKKGDEPPAT